LPYQFISKDKKIWDEKVRLENWKDLQAYAQLSLSPGIDLVNLYFRPCNDDYEKTIIKSSTAIGQWSEHPSIMGIGHVFVPSLLSAKVDKLMGNFSVENDIFFKSIIGLAFGAYAFRLSQFSKNGSLLFKSEYKFFRFKRIVKPVKKHFFSVYEFFCANIYFKFSFINLMIERFSFVSFFINWLLLFASDK